MRYATEAGMYVTYRVSGKTLTMGGQDAPDQILLFQLRFTSLANDSHDAILHDRHPALASEHARQIRQKSWLTLARE